MPKPLTSHEQHCLDNAVKFSAVRGAKPATRVRREFPTIDEARAFAAEFGDGRTMIYAVTILGLSGHIENA